MAFEVLQTITLQPLHGVYFRLVPSVYAAVIEETGPSFTYGGRYNIREAFGALYLAESPETAWQEILKYYHNHREWIPDQVLGEFEVHIERGLNLTDPAVLQLLAVTKETLIDPVDRHIPQQIGHVAWQNGIEAIRFPSAAMPDAANLVVFRDHLNPPSRITRIALKPFQNPA